MSEFSRIFNQKAVALSYDEERGLAPAVVASGSGFLAERIVESLPGVCQKVSQLASVVASTGFAFAV